MFSIQHNNNSFKLIKLNRVIKQKYYNNLTIYQNVNNSTNLF